MNSDSVIEKLQGLLPELKEIGVKQVWLFGSAGRNESKPYSDIDILVKLERQDFALYCQVCEKLENVFDRKVDLVMVEALRPQMRERVMGEARLVA